jgi:hypothetical protein
VIKDVPIAPVLIVEVQVRVVPFVNVNVPPEVTPVVAELLTVITVGDVSTVTVNVLL